MGCVKDYFDFDKLSTHVQASSRWTLPVAYGSLSFHDILTQLDDTSSNFHILSRDTIILRLEDQIASQTAADFITMNDKIYTQTFTKADYDNAGGFSGGNVLMTKIDQQFPFDAINALIIKTALMQHTDLTITVNTNISHRGFLTINFPQITYLGTTFTYTIELMGGSTHIVRNLPLENYEIDYRYQFVPTTKFIEYRLTLLDNGSGNFDSSDQLTVNVQMENNQYTVLYGYIGQINYIMENSKIKFGVLNSITSGNAVFGNPRLYVNIKNSFGLPVKFGFTELYAKSVTSSLDINITGGRMYDTNPLFLGAPSILHLPNLIPVDTVLYPISSGNSNIGEVLGAIPEYISYTTKFLANPNASTDTSNFIHRNSILDVKLTMDIPLELKTSGLVFMDTLDMTMDLDSSMWNRVKNIKLKIDVGNGFPHNINIQGIFIDENNNRIDSLFPGEDNRLLVESGIINPTTGRINQQTGKTTKTTFVEVNGDRVNNLRRAKKIIIFAKYTTTYNQNNTQNLVIYYENYSMDVKITSDIDILIDEHL